MTVPGNLSSPLLATAAAAGGGGGAAAGSTKSLRFNSADSAQLSRTPSSAGNRKTWTWSAWVKRGKLGTFTTLFSSSNGTGPVSRGGFSFHSNDKLKFWSNPSGSSETANFETDAVFRDASAWYHIVLHIDTTQSTNTDRIKVYVNGAQQSFSSVTYMAQNEDAAFNQAFLHSIGEYQNTDYGEYYLTDVHFIDGSALGPTSFGAYDSNSVWQAAEYSGTFGTNGFHLKFDDASSNAALGTDSSGNGNTWSVYNLLAAASGVSITSIKFDVQTNAGGSMRKFFIGSTAVTSSVYATATNNISQYDSGHGTGQFPNAHDGNESTNLDWKFGDITYTFTNKSANYVEFIGHMVNGTVQINGTTYTPVASGTSSGGRTIYRITLVDPADVDSLFDVPTNGSQSDTGAGGEVSGNYCTFNPIDINSQGSLSNGNLDWSTTNGNGVCRGTIAVSSGKWYFEFTYNQKPSGGGAGFGVLEVSESRDFPGAANAPNGYTYYSEGESASFTKKYGQGSNSNYGASYAPGDVIGVALDLDGGTITFYKNGASQGQAFSGISGTYAPSVSSGTSVGTAKATLNAGQRAFAYSAPSGFKALCTANLPTPTIADGTDYFAASVWTGDGSSSVSVTTGFEPDFIWIKQRNKTYYHQLYDAVRGYGVGKALASNENTVEGYGGSNQYGYVSATTSTGFTGTAGSGTPLYVNENNTTYVAWSWDAGSSTVSNTDGTITSSVRASQTAGCSIVNYVGTGANASVGHNLGAVPGMIIIKNRDTQRDDAWRVWHSSLAANERLVLNEAKGKGSDTTLWQNTLPTSTVFYLDSDNRYNTNGDDHIAYCFAPVAGYSAMGKFTGNASSNGPFIYTGFRPAFIICKRIDANDKHWILFDNKRYGYNVSNLELLANLTVTENNTNPIDILSNGFKIRTGTSPDINGSGGTIVYYAVAESPFQANGGLAR